MYRLGMLLRALPSILAELLSLIWYAYRTGDRRMATAALVWLTCTVTLIAFGLAALVAVFRGGEIHLRGPFLAASLPIAMWIARELVSAALAFVHRTFRGSTDRSAVD